jgi:hypothetical protein
MIGLGGIQQQQRVAGGRGIEHDEAASGLGSRCARRRGRPRSPPCRASARSSSSNARPPASRSAPRWPAPWPGSASSRGLGQWRVDPQAVHRRAERRCDMGGRIGGAEVNTGCPRFTRPTAMRGGDGGLSDPALAHHHDQPAAGQREFVDQPAQPGDRATPVGRPRRRRRGVPARRPAPVAARPGRPDCRRTAAVLRSCGQRLQGLAADRRGPGGRVPRIDRATASPGSVAAKTPLMASRWLTSPSARQLGAGPRGLAQRRRARGD